MIEIPVKEADPGIFVVNWAQKIGAVIYQDGQIVDGAHPAAVGETLLLYGTGLGAVDPPPPPDGFAAPSAPLSFTLNTPTVLIDGMACPVSFSGLASGFVGPYQINFTVPEGLSAGAHELTVSVGNSQSNTVRLFTR